MIYKFKFFFESLEATFQKFYQSVLSVFKVIILSKFNIQLPESEKNEAVVLGNGPSLRNILENNRTRLLNKEIYSVNLFPSSKEYIEVMPGNLVWLDNGFYNYPSKDALQKERPDLFKTINDVIQRTSWKMNLFLPQLSRKCVYLSEIEKLNSNVRIVYFNYTIVKGFESVENFFFTRGVGMPACENVLAACLFLAINCKFKTIYLCGADHSWMANVSVNENNELLINEKHFYTKESEENVHRIVNPLSKSATNIASFCLSQMKAFQSYYVMDRYAKYRGTSIINASKGSYVDAFRRGGIE